MKSITQEKSGEHGFHSLTKLRGDTVIVIENVLKRSIKGEKLPKQSKNNPGNRNKQG